MRESDATPPARQLPRIEKIETYEVRVPRRPSNRFVTSYATLPDAEHVLVRVHADGLVGLGEAATERWWSGEDAVTVRNAIDRYLAPAIVGESGGIRAALNRMDDSVAGNFYAKAAIEMALWDVLGKASDLPLCALLGAAPRRLEVKYVIGIGDLDHVRSEASRATELGFRYLKLKVGRDLASDLDRVAAVAEVLLPNQRLGVDANAGWSLITALEALDPLRELGVSFLEQPVPAYHRQAMLEITSRSAIPIVAHESLSTAQDGFEAAVGRYAHIWAVTPSNHGGVLRTIDLLGVASAAGIPCLLGSTLELGIATALLAHIGAAFDIITTCPIPSDVIGPLYHEDDVVVEAPLIADGFVHVPAGPGLGVELDLERVAFYRNDGVEHGTSE